MVLDGLEIHLKKDSYSRSLSIVPLPSSVFCAIPALENLFGLYSGVQNKIESIAGGHDRGNEIEGQNA
jgi:hypothetical protein